MSPWAGVLGQRVPSQNVPLGRCTRSECPPPLDRCTRTESPPVRMSPACALSIMIIRTIHVCIMTYIMALRANMVRGHWSLLHRHVILQTLCICENHSHHIIKYIFNYIHFIGEGIHVWYNHMCVCVCFFFF